MELSALIISLFALVISIVSLAIKVDQKLPAKEDEHEWAARLASARAAAKRPQFADDPDDEFPL